MKKTVWFGIAVLVIAGIAAFAAFSHPAEHGSTIRLGAVLGLTGDAATDALNIKRGIELAKADLAKQGVMTEIVYQDDKTDPKQTVSAVHYLLSTSKVRAIIGPTWSFLESAAAPVVAQEKVITYAPADTSEFADVRSPYQFHGAPRNALSAGPVAAWIIEHGTKRVAIITDSSAWGESIKTTFRAAVASTSASVVLDETIQTFSANAAADVASAITKAKALGVDLILWTGYDPDGIALVQTRTRLNFEVPVLAQSTAFDGLLSRNAVTPAELKGMYFLSVPTSKEFVDKFTKAYGEAPGNYAERAYDGYMILVDALQHAPAQDADSLASYLRGKAHEGFAGTYEFNEKGDLKAGEWVIQPIVR